LRIEDSRHPRQALSADCGLRSRPVPLGEAAEGRVHDRSRWECALNRLSRKSCVLIAAEELA